MNIKLLAVFIFLLPLFLTGFAAGCEGGNTPSVILQNAAVTSNVTEEGFAIYLTSGDIPPGRMSEMSFDIAGQPFIGLSDIISYNGQTHELKLTPDSFERISQLDVPVQGKAFAVCVDKSPVYTGAFWTPISSISFDGVTIWKPFTKAGPPVVTLELGYPSSSFYGGKDPRNEPQIISSLEQAGKYIPKLSLADIDVLPQSVKGFELYSWMENGRWLFTLLTGTDRNKTLDEIVSGGNFISETGWLKIQGAGIDEIETALDKLPPGASVFWLTGMWPENTAYPSISLALPPQPVIDALRDHAVRRDLDFTVPAP
jgi:hypothetical protein